VAFPTADASEGFDPLVTVVIPARNEERSVARCLESVLAQEQRGLQVIVVDGGSSDRTSEIVASVAAMDPRVHVIHYGVASIPGALNAALREAVGRWFVRVDAHSTIPPDYVATALVRLVWGGGGGVGGRKDAIGATHAGVAISAALSSRFGVGNSTYHHGTRRRVVDHVPFGAYATDTLRRIGGWDERLVANEDFELDYRLRRAGYRLLFDPDLRIAWRCRDSIPDLFRQYVRYGAGKADVAVLHPASLEARHVAPPALIVLLTIAAASTLVSPPAAIALAAPYGAALAIAVVSTARRVPGWRAKALLPFAFVGMHLGWGLGFFKGLVASATGRGPHDRGMAPAPVARRGGSEAVGERARGSDAPGSRTDGSKRSETTMRRRIA
jgi:cellulose synthase/poly-beta-1,6-N-acetylglucosamine synthase-like glycosyltransferase